jgi:hypothetical protein
MRDPLNIAAVIRYADGKTSSTYYGIEIENDKIMIPAAAGQFPVPVITDGGKIDGYRPKWFVVSDQGFGFAGTGGVEGYELLKGQSDSTDIGGVNFNPNSITGISTHDAFISIDSENRQYISGDCVGFYISAKMDPTSRNFEVPVYADSAQALPMNSGFSGLYVYASPYSEAALGAWALSGGAEGGCVFLPDAASLPVVDSGTAILGNIRTVSTPGGAFELADTIDILGYHPSDYSAVPVNQVTNIICDRYTGAIMPGSEYYLVTDDLGNQIEAVFGGNMYTGIISDWSLFTVVGREYRPLYSGEGFRFNGMTYTMYGNDAVSAPLAVAPVPYTDIHTHGVYGDESVIYHGRQRALHARDGHICA